MKTGKTDTLKNITTIIQTSGDKGGKSPGNNVRWTATATHYDTKAYIPWLVGNDIFKALKKINQRTQEVSIKYFL